MNQPDFIVTLQDVYSLPALNDKTGFCAQGCREWASAKGLDWFDFVQNGISAQTLLKTGDPMALRAVEWAIKNRGGIHG